MSKLGTRRISRTSGVNNELTEMQTTPLDGDTSTPAYQDYGNLNFGKIDPYKETPPAPNTEDNNAVFKQIISNYENNIIPIEDIFSKRDIEYPYEESLITEATEVTSIADHDFLLDYVYKKEEEVGATILASSYGVSDSIFEYSKTHEIVELGGDRYLSNKEQSLNKDRLNLLLSDISKALATVGVFDLPLIKMHTFKGSDDKICSIKSLSINTFEYNAILGLCNKFNEVTTIIYESNNEIIMRFEKK